MITLLAAFSVVALSAQNPQAVGELRALARDGPDSVLIERARQRPNDAREALRQLLAAAGSGGDTAGVAALAGAERLARAFGVAWRDSFLVRRVARFRSLSPADRQATIAADSIRQIGAAAVRSSRFDAAMPPLRESLRRYEALADTAGIAVTLNAVGQTLHRTHENDSAEVYLTRSQDLAQRVGDSRTLGKDAHDLGSVYWRRGENRDPGESVARTKDLQRAKESFARAQEIFEQIGDSAAVRSEYNSFGLIAWTGADLAEARRAFETGLAASRSAGDSGLAALFLSNLGGVALEQGNYAETDDHLRESLAIYRALGDQLNTAQQLRELGIVEQRRGDYPAALATFSEAARMAQRLGPLPYGGLIDPWVLLAQTRTLMGDLQGAGSELDGAEAFARRYGGARARSALMILAFQRGHLALQFNRLAEAERQYARALRLGADSTELAQQSVGLMLRRGNLRGARRLLEQQLVSGPLDPHNAAQVRVSLGLIALQLGDTTAARRAFREALDTLRAVQTRRPGSADGTCARRGIALPTRARAPRRARRTPGRMAAARGSGGRPAEARRARGRGGRAPFGHRGNRAGLRKLASGGAAGRVPGRQMGCVRRARAGRTGAWADGGGVRGERAAAGAADARPVGAGARRWGRGDSRAGEPRAGSPPQDGGADTAAREFA